MRIISLSVDGIHQAAQLGLYDWLETQDADIICLQDLRALEYELDHEVFHPNGYFSYFFDSGVKHYNGVAIYTRHQPKALIYGLGFTRKRRSFIVCGNWGMAHTKKDVENWQENVGRTGFLGNEQQWMGQLFSQLGYVDAFRQVVPDSGEYSWVPDHSDGMQAVRIENRDNHLVCDVNRREQRLSDDRKRHQAHVFRWG